MYHQNAKSNVFRWRALIVLSILCLAVASFAFASPSDAVCTNAVDVDLGTTYRAYEHGADAPHWIRIDVPSAGIMTVDLMSFTEARIGAFDDDCGSAREGVDFFTIERSAARLVLAVRNPGTYSFRVGAQDSRQVLSDYRLLSRFVTATVNEDELELSPRIHVERTHFYSAHLVTRSGEDETEEQPDPNGAIGGSQRLLLSVAELCTTKPQVAQKSGEDETEEQPDPNGLLAGPPSASLRLVLSYGEKDATQKNVAAVLRHDDFLQEMIWPDFPVSEGTLSYVRPTDAPASRFSLASLCPSEDDHSDTYDCATPLASGQSVTAEIGNGWGDDEDVFRLSLDETRTVTVETTGEVSTWTGLYDELGRRLATQDGGSDGDASRVVATLPPGIYFLRVAAEHGEEGTYQVRLETESW